MPFILQYQMQAPAPSLCNSKRVHPSIVPTCFVFNKMIKVGSWRNGTVVKSASCSFRGLGFDSQHLYGILEPSVTPGLRILWIHWALHESSS